MRRLFLALWFGQLGLLSACSIDCGFESHPRGFLDTCNNDSACPSGLTCQCGVCTLACEDDAVCERAGDQPARCVSTEALSCWHASSERVCLATCRANWECGPRGRVCEQGYCGDFEEPYEPPWEEPPVDAASEDAASDATVEDASMDAASDGAASDASSDEDADAPSDDDAG